MTVLHCNHGPGVHTADKASVQAILMGRLAIGHTTGGTRHAAGSSCRPQWQRYCARPLAQLHQYRRASTVPWSSKLPALCRTVAMPAQQLLHGRPAWQRCAAANGSAFGGWTASDDDMQATSSSSEDEDEEEPPGQQRENWEREIEDTIKLVALLPPSGDCCFAGEVCTCELMQHGSTATLPNPCPYAIVLKGSRQATSWCLQLPYSGYLHFPS